MSHLIIDTDLYSNLSFINWVFALYVAKIDLTFMYELDPNYLEQIDLSENSPIVISYQNIAPIIYQYIKKKHNYHLYYFITRNSSLPSYMKLKF